MNTLGRLKKEGRTDDAIALCRKRLPLPAAFRELAVALRKKIREARSSGGDYEENLLELYQIAAYEQFLYESPSVVLSDKGGATMAGRTYPAYNVAVLAHADGVRNDLSLSYQECGTAHLKRLNKTDIKHMNHMWGEPRGERNPREAFQEIWDKYLERYEDSVLQAEAEFARSMKAILQKSNKRWWWPF